MHRMRLCLQEEKGLERTGQDRGGEKEKKEIEKKKGRRGEREKEQWGREGGKKRSRQTTVKESLCYTNYQGLIFYVHLLIVLSDHLSMPQKYCYTKSWYILKLKQNLTLWSEIV